MSTDLVHMQSTSALDLAIAAWLDAKSNRSGSKKTARAYTDTIASFRQQLQITRLDLDADPAAVALVAQAWAGHGDPAPTSYNQRLAIISSFYVFVAKSGLLQLTNPIARVERRPVQSYSDVHALDYEELRTRLGVIDRGELLGQRDYALLAVALQTGRRLSELAALRWGDVQIERAAITLHWRHCKGGKVMADTLPAPLSKALALYLHTLHGTGLHMLAADVPIWIPLADHTRALSIDAIADICSKRLGTSRVHRLRHTFARAMEDAGAKVSDIQARLGHSSLATTGRYLAALKRAENAQGDALASLLGLDG